MAFKLDSELVDKIDELQQAIEERLTEMRQEFEDKPEAFHDSPKAVTVNTWLEEVERISDLLSNITATPRK